jgi:hypothetical protein
VLEPVSITHARHTGHDYRGETGCFSVSRAFAFAFTTGGWRDPHH